MEDYRRLLLAERGGGRVAAEAESGRRRERRSAAEKRRALAPLRAEVETCEKRIAKLEEMRAALDQRLADPELYTSDDPAAFETLQIKRAEVEAGLARAEALWMEATERLEAES
jgi:ATP-binding cassette subfamily F protein 3